jgi:hypothetical protein
VNQENHIHKSRSWNSEPLKEWIYLQAHSHQSSPHYFIPQGCVKKYMHLPLNITTVIPQPPPPKKKTHDFTIYLNPYWVINVEVMSFLEPYILSWLSHTFNSIVADHEVKYLSFTSTSIVP